VLRATADDGALQSSDVVTFTVSAAADCDLVAQTGCAASEACYFDESAWAPRCMPAGTPGVGEPCSAWNQCAPGHTCILAACRRLCDTAAPPTGACQCGELVPAAGFCQCNEFDPTGCGPGKRCLSGPILPTCGPAGSETEGSACGTDADCATGLICDAGYPNSPNPRTCMRQCDLSNPDADPSCYCQSGSSPRGVCGCDPLNQTGCGANQACYVERTGGHATCMEYDFFSTLCQFDTDCGPGTACAQFSPGDGRCTNYCDLGNASCACRSITSFSDIGQCGEGAPCRFPNGCGDERLTCWSSGSLTTPFQCIAALGTLPHGAPCGPGIGGCSGNSYCATIDGVTQCRAGCRVGDGRCDCQPAPEIQFLDPNFPTRFGACRSEP
jgi:hypothetical protein